MENLVISENLLPVELPTYFLKIGGCLFWIIFLQKKYSNPKL